MTKIEKTSVIEEDVSIGENCYIGHFTLIRKGVKIGNNSEVRAHCFIAPDVIIGSNVLILQYSNICQGTRIEDNVFIGAKCMMTNTRRIKHRRNFDLKITPPYIEYGARIGSRVTLLPGVRIGNNSLIGAGSVVSKDIPPKEVHIGVPTKFIKMVPEDELI